MIDYITQNQSVEEQEYYFILSLFNDNYSLFAIGLKELTKCNIKNSVLTELISDIRFYKSQDRLRNYDKLKPFIEELLDLNTNTIKDFVKWKECFISEDMILDNLEERD